MSTKELSLPLRGIQPEEEEKKHSTRDIFPFFELAQELRDLIYIQCLTTRVCYTHEGYRLEAFGVPDTDTSLLNRQFHSEYLQVSQEHSSLIISESEIPTTREPEDVETTWERLPVPATIIPRVTFVVECAEEEDVVEGEMWVNRFLCEMSGARSLSLQFPLAVGVRREVVESALMWSDYWTRIPGLRDLGVWRARRDRRGKCVKKTKLLTWDPETRGFRREGVEEEGEGNVSGRLRAPGYEAYAWYRYG